MKAVIFAGGTGKRLWPLSRKKTPKQLHPFYKAETSLHHSLEILSAAVDTDDIYIATSARLKDEILHVLPQISEEQLILESSVRDTGPALGFAMTKLLLNSPDEPVIIRWQNSIIKDPVSYGIGVEKAAEILEREDSLALVYMVVPSKFPNTGVGYVLRGDEIDNYGSGVRRYEFLGFTEKPEIDKAKQLHQEGHGWNAGCYLTTPKRFLSLVELYAPDLFSKLMEIKTLLESSADENKVYEIYDSIDPISVDYIISENLKREQTGLIFADYDWHYISTWDNVLSAFDPNKSGNVIEGNVLAVDISDSLVMNTDPDSLVGVIGVEDISVIKHGDAVLVCRNQDASRVKELYTMISEDEKLTKFS